MFDIPRLHIPSLLLSYLACKTLSNNYVNSTVWLGATERLHFRSRTDKGHSTRTTGRRIRIRRAVLHSRFRQCFMCIHADASAGISGDHRVIVLTITLMQCRMIDMKKSKMELLLWFFLSRLLRHDHMKLIIAASVAYYIHLNSGDCVALCFEAVYCLP